MLLAISIYQQDPEILYYHLHLKDSLKNAYLNILSFFCSFSYRGKVIINSVSNITGIGYGITITNPYDIAKTVNFL